MELSNYLQINIWTEIGKFLKKEDFRNLRITCKIMKNFIDINRESLQKFWKPKILIVLNYYERLYHIETHCKFIIDENNELYGHDDLLFFVKFEFMFLKYMTSTEIQNELLPNYLYVARGDYNWK
jgi:hypothetical protein